MSNIENTLILKRNEKGQSLVEFILLFAIIVGISFAFMKAINGGLGKRWLAIGNQLLIDTDNNQKLELR